MTKSERFDAKCEPVPMCGCIIWMGAIFNEKGYGAFGGGRAHRYAYERLFGPIPSGMQIDHLCRVRCCVNPHHLEVVTPRENTIRGVSPAAVNARKTHCVRGHLLEGDNLMSNDSWRRCRECARCDSRLYRERHGEAYKTRQRIRQRKNH